MATAKEVIKCPEGHTKIWKKGYVPSREGLKARYVCYTCGKSFYKKEKKEKKAARKTKKGG